MRYRHTYLLALAMALVVIAAACIEDIDSFEASIDDVGIPDDTSFDDVEPIDDTSNGDEPDVASPDDTTTPTCPEPNHEMTCAANAAECGEIDVVDGCGNTHTIECGVCTAPEECHHRSCITPSCDDGLQSGEQTDVDCGGPQCPGCGLGKQCNDDSDCAESWCHDGVCDLRRTDDGLIALYTFEGGDEETVFDQSTIAPAADLEFEYEGDDPDEAIQWGQQCDCIEFDGAMLRSDDTEKFYGRIIDPPTSFSIETWIESQNLSQDGPARIVSLSNPADRNPQHVIFGQNGAHMTLRFRNEDQSSGTPSDESFHETATTDLAHYVVTVANDELHLYKNGESVGDDPIDVNSHLVGWDTQYPLVMGNDPPNFDRPWRGRMHLTAIYNRALTPDEVTEHFRVGHEEL